MSYLKIWNEEINNYEVFDIGRGRFHVNTKDWVLIKRETENQGWWDILKYSPSDDLSVGSLLKINDNVTLNVDEVFYNFSKWQSENWKNGDYNRMKIINFGVDKIDEFDHSVAVPYGAPIFHVNEKGKTIDRY